MLLSVKGQGRTNKTAPRRGATTTPHLRARKAVVRAEPSRGLHLEGEEDEVRDDAGDVRPVRPLVPPLRQVRSDGHVGSSRGDGDEHRKHDDADVDLDRFKSCFKLLVS